MRAWVKKMTRKRKKTIEEKKNRDCGIKEEIPIKKAERLEETKPSEAPNPSV